jgi:hypothetical protein
MLALLAACLRQPFFKSARQIETPDYPADSGHSCPGSRSGGGKARSSRAGCTDGSAPPVGPISGH